MLRVASYSLAVLTAFVVVACTSGLIARAESRSTAIRAYSSQADWLTDTYDEVSILRDRATAALKAMEFQVETIGAGGVKATKRDKSLDDTALAQGRSIELLFQIEREAGDGLTLNRVTLKAEVKYAPHIGKHPFSGVRHARQEVEQAQARVARAIDQKVEAVLDVTTADALQPYVGKRITLRGSATNMKAGIFFNGKDVKIKLPDDTRGLFTEGTERSLEISGTLNLVSESHWHQSANDGKESPIGMEQDALSRQTPIEFELVP